MQWAGNVITLREDEVYTVLVGTENVHSGDREVAVKIAL
jgi:mannose-6-phosphate isomerase-like protein (cupin superfamily)